MPKFNPYLPLGLLLHEWHNGMDAIYAVGSQFRSNCDVSIELVDRAIERFKSIKIHLPKDTDCKVLGTRNDINKIITRLNRHKEYLRIVGKNEMAKGYVCAILFTLPDEDQGKYGPYDFDSKALESIKKDCESFLSQCKGELDEPYTMGADFYLTRIGSGAGFENEVLESLAKGFGHEDYYVGDDGIIYKL